MKGKLWYLRWHNEKLSLVIVSAKCNYTTLTVPLTDRADCTSGVSPSIKKNPLIAASSKGREIKGRQIAWAGGLFSSSAEITAAIFLINFSPARGQRWKTYQWKAPSEDHAACIYAQHLVWDMRFIASLSLRYSLSRSLFTGEAGRQQQADSALNWFICYVPRAVCVMHRKARQTS